MEKRQGWSAGIFWGRDSRLVRQPDARSHERMPAAPQPRNHRKEPVPGNGKNAKNRRNGTTPDADSHTSHSSHPSHPTRPIIPPRGDYRTLLSFQKAEVVFDITFRFAHRFLDRRDR